MFDTIAAISTALNNGAISIIRMSGDEAISIANSVFSKDLNKKASNTITHGFIQDGNEIIDEVLVSVFRAPKTYTCEDIVEINSHGGAYVTRKVLALLLSKGARLALPGEFTKRAYLNGRINLSEAESINDLINADSDIKHKSAISGMNGSIKRIVDPLLDKLLKVIGTIEVNIDYPEYDDVEIMTETKISPMLNEFDEQITSIISKARRFMVIKDGLKVAIVGKPNVGKSSLLNALLEKDKAIVTSIAGTTRDLVEDSVKLEKITLHLIDTAGIRESNDIVESIGIERSKKAIESSDLVIFVIDETYNQEDTELFNLIKEKKHIIVRNKTDVEESKDDYIHISAKNNDIKDLIDYFNETYKDDYSLIDEDVLNNERQISKMMEAQEEIKLAKKALEDGFEMDIISDNLYAAYHSLKEILGEDSREDLIDSLFKNFCLGK